MRNGIQYFLDKNGITIDDFAKDIGVSSQSVDNWIKQRNEPKPSIRKKIVDYFKVPANEIFFI